MKRVQKIKFHVYNWKFILTLIKYYYNTSYIYIDFFSFSFQLIILKSNNNNYISY